ncbi:hypothetical protein H0H93_009664 [Arthromyces matolae]|nr:hypothetical protein H0H93_009664 [Arthromyces matolae]
MAQSFAIALAIAVGLGVVLFKRTRHRRPPLPPGPPADPIIGHLRKVKLDDMTLYELGKTYGDVIYLQMLGQPTVVLNSVEAAVDLLEKRSATYSDRPPFRLFEILAWNHTLTFTRYGKPFQRYRKFFQEYFKPSMISSHHPIQVLEARRLLQNILFIMRLTYGHEITSNDDPYMDITDKVGHALGNVGPPGGTAIDLFPFLRYMPSWFPGTYYAEFARSQRGATDALHNYPFDQVVKQLAEGNAKPSFLSQTLESLSPDEAKDLDSETIREIKGTAGVMFCGGAETTWSTLSFFFLAMMLHPECQKRAQEEIDSVIGSGRLPEFSDRETLPYVESILLETLRYACSVEPDTTMGDLTCDVSDGILSYQWKPIGPNGEEITPEVTLSYGITSQPSPFQCRIRPRHDRARELILQDLEY